MANSEVYTFTLLIPKETTGHLQLFKIPYKGIVKQISFQAQSLETMELLFQLRSGGDVIFPSNIQLQPIRKWPVVLPVDLEIKKESTLIFNFDNKTNNNEYVTITLVIYKKASKF